MNETAIVFRLRKLVVQLVGYKKVRNVSEPESKNFQTSSESFVERAHPMRIRRQAISPASYKNEALRCRSVAVKFAKELANYREDDISPELRERIGRHFLNCDGCFGIYDGLRKVIRLVNSADIIELPQGFSVRLYCGIAVNSGLESMESQ